MLKYSVVTIQKFGTILLLLFCIALLACKKESKPDVIEKNPFIGEHTYNLGAVQIYLVKIESGIDNQYMIAGYTSNNGTEEYPFLLSIDDSLNLLRTINPAFSEVQTQAMGLAKVNNGFVLLSSSSGVDLTNEGGIRLTKASFSGDIEWEKKLYSGVYTFGPVIAGDKDNSLLVATQSFMLPSYAFHSKLAHIDNDGNVIWDLEIYPDLLSAPEIVITDKQDDYIAVIDSITDCIICEQFRVSVPVVYKINKQGQILWTQRLESNNGGPYTAIAATDNSNNIILAYEPGAQNGASYQNKKAIAKLENSGNILWQTYLTKDMFNWATSHSGGFERMREIAFDAENNIYVLGYISENSSSGPQRLAIAKLSYNGEVIKIKVFKNEFEHQGINYEYQGISIKSVSDNKFIVLAARHSPYAISVFYLGSDLMMK